VYRYVGPFFVWENTGEACPESPFREEEGYPGNDILDFVYRPVASPSRELVGKLDAAMREDSRPEVFGDPKRILGVTSVQGFSVGLLPRKKKHGTVITALVTVITDRELPSAERQKLYNAVSAQMSGGWGKALTRLELVPGYVVRVFDPSRRFELAEEEPESLVSFQR